LVELRSSLGERQEKCEQRSADQDPLRDPYVDGLGSCGRPDHEERGDREHVDQDDVLEAEAVSALECEEGGQERKRGEPEWSNERDRG
jgi:hypothetical protein